MMTNVILFPTSKTKAAKLRQLIRVISNSRESNFYKKLWVDMPLKNVENDFKYLPIISIKDIINCKLDDRLYIKNGLFVKIIYHDNVPYLLAKTKSDISKEDYGRILYKRPLVIFENTHESIEKGLWHHDKNTLPLIAEDNLDLTLMIAGRYEIDSIVGDTKSIRKLLSSEHHHFDYKKIANITTIDTRFGADFTEALNSFFPFAKIQIILALPETGSLSRACNKQKDKTVMFHPSENTLIETDKGGFLIATRLVLLPTPIIKYKTDIKIKEETNGCSCGSELSFSLQN